VSHCSGNPVSTRTISISGKPRTFPVVLLAPWESCESKLLPHLTQILYHRPTSSTSAVVQIRRGNEACPLNAQVTTFSRGKVDIECTMEREATNPSSVSLAKQWACCLIEPSKYAEQSYRCHATATSSSGSHSLHRAAQHGLPVFRTLKINRTIRAVPSTAPIRAAFTTCISCVPSSRAGRRLVASSQPVWTVGAPISWGLGLLTGFWTRQPCCYARPSPTLASRHNGCFQHGLDLPIDMQDALAACHRGLAGDLRGNRVRASLAISLLPLSYTPS